MAKFRILFIVFTFAVACSRDAATNWYLDSSFSKKLISSWDDRYQTVTKEDPAKSISVLQIFRTLQKEDSSFTLEGIRSQQLIYETRLSDDVVAIFRAARVESKDSCDINEYDAVHYIVGFDRDLLRAGIIKYFPCKTDDLGYFQTWGSKSVYFSANLARHMKRILPAKL